MGRSAKALRGSLWQYQSVVRLSLGRRAGEVIARRSERQDQSRYGGGAAHIRWGADGPKRLVLEGRRGGREGRFGIWIDCGEEETTNLAECADQVKGTQNHIGYDYYYVYGGASARPANAAGALVPDAAPTE
jgi:hypothetical protein